MAVDPEGPSYAYKLVPRQLLDRPKAGFSVLSGNGCAGRCAPWAEELLDPARLRREGWFDADTVTRARQLHLSGRIDWSARLWTVLMFQTWLERYHAAPKAALDRVSQWLLRGCRHSC